MNNLLDLKVILEIKEVVDETERRINHVDTIAKGLNIPSVNELRYTLNHLLKYLTKNTEDDVTKALRHSKRALYDCYEAEVIFFHEKFEKFEEDYRIEPIGKLVPEIHEWRTHFELLRDFIQNTPRNDRDKYYEDLKAKHNKTHDIILKLKSARHEISNHLIKEQEERNRNIRLLKWTIIAAVGVLLTLFFTIMEWRKPSKEQETTNPPTQLSVPKPMNNPPHKKQTPKENRP